MKSSEDAERLREIVSRVSRQVAQKTGKPRAELVEIVTSEVAAALAAPPPKAASTAGPTQSKGSQALARAELCASCLEQERRKAGRRAVVTTTGKNRKGVVAKIAQGIADAGGDILDISQTLVSDYFTMIIIVDVSALEVPFTEFKSRITKTVESLGAECLVMHEEIVTALQRI
jgi:ACT domain-containing protein